MKSVIDHSPAHTKDVLQNIGKLENIYNNMFAAMNEASVGKFPKEHIETNKIIYNKLFSFNKKLSQK